MSSLFSDVSGAGSVLMAQMAIDDFTVAEKPSFKIKMLSADMQLKADLASTIARSWFDQERVDMITDMPLSAATLSVMKLAEDKNRVVMSTGAASQSISGEDCSPNTTQWVYDAYSQTFVTAATITKAGGKKWFIVTADTLGAKAYADQFAAGVLSAGGTVVGRILHPLGASDFSSYVLQAQASGADVIGLATQTVDATSFLRQANEYGLKQQMVTAVLHASDVNSTGMEITKGINVVDAFYWDRTPETRALSKRYFDKRQKMPTFAQAGVYSAVYQYLKAVKLAGTDEAKAVVKQLKSMPINDAVFQNGKVRPDGKMVHDMYLLQVKAPNESKYPWDYMKIKT
ncbi:MAG: ABC transporter substrate-binding protein, partial [Bradyrhizobium sp.]